LPKEDVMRYLIEWASNSPETNPTNGDLVLYKDEGTDAPGQRIGVITHCSIEQVDGYMASLVRSNPDYFTHIVE